MKKLEIPKKVRFQFREPWLSAARLVFTSPVDEISSVKIADELVVLHPWLSRGQALGVWQSARVSMEKSGLLECHKTSDKVGVTSKILDRERVGIFMEAIGEMALRVPSHPERAASSVEPVEQEKAPSGNGIFKTRAEKMLPALLKRCREYRKEVAELIDELAACRATVHDATSKVGQASTALKRLEAVASEIDLSEFGIDLEE